MSLNATPEHGAIIPESPSAAPSQALAAQSTSTVPSPLGDKMDGSPAPDRAPSESVPQSQPMTATGSNSSEHPAVDNGDGSTAAPYGTRSRNRPSGSRPNYADDKEIDMEIEAAGKYSKAAKKAATAAAPVPAAAQTPPPPDNESESHTGGGFASINAGAQAMVGSPDHPPAGSGHYNVLPPPQAVSKKRKQPGSNTTVATANVTPKARSNTVSSQSRSFVETNMMTFERCGGRLNNKKQLVADDGTTLEPNEHAYFICEPPGEPYYLARIMEFLHTNNDPRSPVDAMRVNWYYRPKDIQRRVQDTRVVFASMHSDTCPLTSIRGKCVIQHLTSIASLDEYRVQKDCFWFDKLYDRYMHRYYEVVPTDKVVNVPPHVKKVLDERWKFVLVEVGRGRDLTSASKLCKRCSGFASNHNSVDCAVCKNTYHMACVRPPLQKKPARGFAWACGPCSRAQELRLEARNTPTASDSAAAGDDDMMDEEEDDPSNRDQATRESSVGLEAHPPPTAAQLAQANLWPYRYLGIHSRPEDALDYDDRIYPRASSRLGPRHQANVNVWHGRPVEFVKPAEGKKKYKASTDGKKSAKAATVGESDKVKRQTRPKWVIDEPQGYIARGHDEPVEISKTKKEYTAQLTFKMPEVQPSSERGGDDSIKPDNSEAIVDEYIKRVKPLASKYGVEDVSTDFLTKAVEKLQENNYDIEKALEAMAHLSIKGDLKQPDLNREEVKRFEEGVAKYGSELHLVARHVSPTIKEGRIVRFYYQWKKTDKGRQIWGAYEGRRSKKESRRVEKDGTSVKLLDDVADDHDDSAFDNDKAVQKKRGFLCKFCETRTSRQWRRAPGTAPGTLVPADATSKNAKDKSSWLTLALCGKCAYLWRRYAIQYESIEEVARKIAAAGGRASKRKIDEELMRTVIEAQHEAGDTITKNVAQMATSAGVEVPAAMVQTEEPPKKKVKADKEGHAATPEVVPEKKKPVPPPEPEPLEPEPPRVKIHPCAVCTQIDVPHDRLLKCRDCRLHVHGGCYGVGPEISTNPWFCDMCRNDHSTQVSTIYECILCPIKCTPQELMEAPKVSHKKKTDRERDKERLEREIVQEAGKRWRQEQEAAGRPVNPREALKRTAWNNWIHVTCALWTKEIKFGNAELLDAAEGKGFIPPERYQQSCKVCKGAVHQPTVTCQFPNCGGTFHVGCAHQTQGYKFGFDVAPVKGSRRDSVAVMKLDQEIGAVTPGIWCSAHTTIPTIVHEPLEMTPSGLTAMQEYARTYKQVDTSVTGTVRRAAQFSQNLIPGAPAVQPPHRRPSTMNGAVARSAAETAAGRTMRSPSPLSPNAQEHDTGRAARKGTKKCCSCLIEVSPKWWQVNGAGKPTAPALSNGVALHSEPHLNGTLRAGGLVNGLVKSEPVADAIPVGLPHAHEAIQWQCHKCHVEKKTPPSSPSQVRPREKPRPEPVQEPVFFQPSYPPAPPPALFPAARPPIETPVLAHPPVNGVPPPHSSPWQAPPPPPPPQWAAPPLRNGTHVAPPPPPSHVFPPPPQPYRSGLPPPPGPDFTSPYGRPPSAGYPPPPPPPGVRPSINGPLHHSPPPPHYAQQSPVSISAQTPRPTSPRAFSTPIDRPGIPSPQMGLGSSSILSRPFAPEAPRQHSSESPAISYTSILPPRQYQPLPPPPSSLGRPSPAQNLTQIAQAATDQTGHPSQPPSHTRHTSVDALGTPRLGGAGGVRSGLSNESPSQRPATPADVVAQAQASNNNVNPGNERRTGNAASASPSLKHLLS